MSVSTSGRKREEAHVSIYLMYLIVQLSTAHHLSEELREEEKRQAGWRRQNIVTWLTSPHPTRQASEGEEGRKKKKETLSLSSCEEERKKKEKVKKRKMCVCVKC